MILWLIISAAAPRIIIIWSVAQSVSFSLLTVSVCKPSALQNSKSREVSLASARISWERSWSHRTISLKYFAPSSKCSLILSISRSNLWQELIFGFYLAPGLSRRDIIVALSSHKKPSYCFLHPFFYHSSIKPHVWRLWYPCASGFSPLLYLIIAVLSTRRDQFVPDTELPLTL